MAANPGEIAKRLFEGVMGPLVLGGALRPGHAIGARAALALGGDGTMDGLDASLFDRVQTARVRRARMLTPVDTVDLPAPPEWAMAAALHDVLQSANPSLDAALRRKAAARILELAHQTLERVPPPAHAGDALSRHTWFARVLDVAREDTSVSWWTGSRVFRGVPPPGRLKAWPNLRRVNVVTTPRPLLELEPLAVDREKLAEAVTLLLARTPLTDLATCARTAPPFAWSEGTLALVGTRAGRTLALRALARVAVTWVDVALGRATRELLTHKRATAAPAIALLAERTLALAQTAPGSLGGRPDGAFARGLGAAAALRMLRAEDSEWPEDERRRLIRVLESAARTDAVREAAAMLEGAS
ncbi:MAG TPA: hypothetical protein VF765_25800 [Polyangiaceae bacterium]